MARWTEEMLDALAERMAQASETLARSEERLAATNESNARSNEANSNAIAAARVETEELKKTLAQFIGIVGEFVQATNSRLAILEDRQ
jgi:hypothetical protein